MDLLCSNYYGEHAGEDDNSDCYPLKMVTNMAENGYGLHRSPYKIIYIDEGSSAKEDNINFLKIPTIPCNDPLSVSNSKIFEIELPFLYTKMYNDIYFFFILNNLEISTVKNY